MTTGQVLVLEPRNTEDQIREIIATEAGGATQAHDLRTRHAGSITFIDDVGSRRQGGADRQGGAG